MRNLKALAVIGLAGLSISMFGCATSNSSADSANTKPKTETSFFENQMLEHDVSQTLSNYFPKANLNIVAYDNKVLLTGQVATESQKQEAYQKTKDLPNVSQVWNYLEVESNIGFSQSTTDAYLTTAAKSRLIAQKEINTNNIKVVTENGSVFLLGKNVGNTVQLGGAIDGIKSISGVKKIVNLTEK